VDPVPADRRLTDRGVSSVQFLLASGLGLLLFLAMANLVVAQYGRGALRSALDQGARAGAVSSSVDDCMNRIESVLAQLLGGRMGDSVVTGCAVGPDVITASARAVFESWTPFTSDFAVEMTAVATRELPP
jgi:hypothetical protein